jgi:hypothetical protein
MSFMLVKANGAEELSLAQKTGETLATMRALEVATLVVTGLAEKWGKASVDTNDVRSPERRREAPIGAG